MTKTIQSERGLYPFRFQRLTNGREVVTNEVGEFVIAPAGTVRSLLEETGALPEPLYRELIAKQIVYDGRSEALIDLLALKYRTKKSALGRGVGLHIVITTLRCDQACTYCQASSKAVQAQHQDMTLSVADEVAKFIVASASPEFTVEMQGGESTLAFGVVQRLVDAVTDLAGGKTPSFVLCTHLANVSKNILEYCRDHNVTISTSLDGPEDLHDRHRIMRGCGSYKAVVEGIRLAQEIVGSVSALTTVTRDSLGRAKEIVDAFVSLGLRDIFLRRVTPLGRSLRQPDLAKYSTEEFLSFYFEALDYMLDLNRNGLLIAEAYSSVLLRRILSPFGCSFTNLQSPSVAGTGVLAYHINGDVYPQDEGRMFAEQGDTSFRLGNVRTLTPTELSRSEDLVRMTTACCCESLPGCSDCAYLPYCGIDPLLNVAHEGDVVGIRPYSAFCQIQLAIFNWIFDKLSSADLQTQKILWRWAFGGGETFSPDGSTR